jgi:nickel/cobalt transporter (NicO) family protein
MQKILKRRITAGLFAFLAAIVMTLTAVAETPAPKSPLGLPVPAQSTTAPATVTEPPAASSRGVVSSIWTWVFETQSRLNRDMAAAVRGLNSDNPIAAALTLIGIAFAYGVLHAAGPGHGKAVISSYVLANEETVRRGIALSFLAALFQALSAILFVGILALVLKQTSLQMRSTEATIETLSWGLVAAVGAYLLWRQIAPLLAARPEPDDSEGPAGASQAELVHPDGHTHGPDCGCGHSHMPSPRDLQGSVWSWRQALPLALSVGIRPCSGAILLLIFALSQGMLWAGVIGTFAMAFGTAITVSILASMAVGSRNWAERMSGPGSVWAARIQTTAGIAGAGLVFLLGAAFFVASLKGSGPL